MSAGAGPIGGDGCPGAAHRLVGGVRAGVDVVDIARIEAFVDDDAPVLARLFTDDERAYAAGRANPAASLAGIWAAKEAWCKATATSIRSVDPRRIEVLHDPCGAPRIEVDGTAVDGSVSIAHDGPVAVAFALSDIGAPHDGSGPRRAG